MPNVQPPPFTKHTSSAKIIKKNSPLVLVSLESFLNTTLLSFAAVQRVLLGKSVVASRVSQPTFRIGTVSKLIPGLTYSIDSIEVQFTSGGGAIYTLANLGPLSSPNTLHIQMLLSEVNSLGFNSLNAKMITVPPASPTLPPPVLNILKPRTRKVIVSPKNPAEAVPLYTKEELAVLNSRRGATHCVQCGKPLEYVIGTMKMCFTCEGHKAQKEKEKYV